MRAFLNPIIAAPPIEEIGSAVQLAADLTAAKVTPPIS